MKRAIILPMLMATLGVSGAVTTRDYVHDGLIAYWDARFSGGGSEKWTDLVGGRSFELHDVTRSTADLTFKGKADSYAFLSAADSAAVFEGHTNLTFEIVAKYPNANDGGLFKSTAASGVAVRFVDGNRFFCCGSSRPRFQSYAFKDKNVTLAVTYTDALSQSCYANGTVVNSNNSVWGGCSGDFGGTYLGQLGNGASPFAGKVYAIRVYDRHLTAAEAASNAALDAEWQFAAPTDAYVRIEGDPTRAGTPTPDYGLIENLSVGDPIDLAAPSEEVLPTASTRFTCTGWTFQGVNGATSSGSTKTASFAFSESGLFRWRFDIENRVTVASPVFGGTASPTDGWTAYGGSVTLTATPETGASFLGWKNESDEIFSTDNPLVLTVDRPRALTPVFVKGSLDPDVVSNFVVRTTGASSPARVDLREGIRVLHDRAELLPFTYSHTNFVGVTGATAESVARVSVARLAPDEPTDDLSLWTNVVAGTERVLREEAGESTVVWHGRTGVWQARFDILNGENVLRTETAVFDMRDLRGGFVLIVK